MSSPGLRRCSHLQARRGLLQTTNDADRGRQTAANVTSLATTVGGPVIIITIIINVHIKISIIIQVSASQCKATVKDVIIHTAA